VPRNFDIWLDDPGPPCRINSTAGAVVPRFRLPNIANSTT
jgi:hypothetical protein